MWIDAHSHLSQVSVAEQADWIQGCREQGITGFFLGGIDPADWHRQRDLKARHGDAVFPSFGLHPWAVVSLGEEGVRKALSELETELTHPSSRVFAIGETGLDYSGDKKESAGLQKAAFQAQLELARTRRLPLVLHVVRAHSDAIAILRQAPGPLRGIVHSFSGTESDARAYLELGFLLSISSNITRMRPDHPLLNAIRVTPSQSLVFETDFPDQPPYGQEKHTPDSLLRVIKAVGALKRVPWQELAQQAVQNLEALGIQHI